MPPTGRPATYHWYAGAAPPLVGVAVKVTLVPGQIAPGGTGAMLTLTGDNAFTVTVTVFDPVHPEAVPVTVYVAVDAGVTDTVVPFKLPGIHA